MKKLCAIFLAFCLLLPGIAAASRLEGEGYATPEEAVLAFIEGMNMEDVGAMLETFAYESYAEHLDSEAAILRMNAVSPVIVESILPTDDYSRSMLAYARFASIATALRYQFVEETMHLDGMTVAPMDPEKIQALYESSRQSVLHDMRHRVEFVRWLNPVELTDGLYASPQNRRYMALLTMVNGADDAIDLAAHIRIKGVDAVRVMRCVRYGDRWYNAELQGTIGSILGLEMSMAGLLVITDDVRDYYIDFLRPGSVDAEILAEWEVIRASDLCGTRWALESHQGYDAAVCDSRDAALDGAGSELWGELRFYGFGGGSLVWAASPALGVRMGLDGGMERIAFAYSGSDGRLSLEDVRRLGPSDSGAEISRATRAGDTITLTYTNGCEAVFRLVRDAD